MERIQSRQARDRRRRNTAASHHPDSNLAATPRRLDGLLPADGAGAITGTETHPDKIEAVAHPAEIEDVLGKIDSAVEDANKYVEKVVHSRRKSDRDIKPAERDQRQQLQAELDKLAEELFKPEYADDDESAESQQT